MTAAAELVVVVDDDLSIRCGLRRLFKSAGYAAETFASAEDYLSREIFDGPTCLVLDVRMPGLNGIELQETLQSRGSCEQIIFITGHSDVPTCTQAMKKGAVDFLLKPFDTDELIPRWRVRWFAAGNACTSARKGVGPAGGSIP